MENGERRMKRILLYIPIIIGIVLLSNVNFAFAQSPSLKTSVDKRQILIGEYLHYSVEATFPVNSYNISWFNLPDSFNHFEIVTRGNIDSIEKNGTLTCRFSVTLTSFDSGVNTIPSFNVGFSPYNDTTVTNFPTDSIPINVSFSPLDSSKTFHDIKSIIEVKDETPWWVWVLGGILLLLIALSIYFLIRYFKKRKKKPAPLFKSKLSPLDEAMESLDKLQKEQLLSKGEVKKFHTRLTEIFKRFVSRKTEKDMLNLTSSEVLLSLHDTLLSRPDTALIANSLRMTDAVKFAKYIPPSYESESALNDTRKVIEQIDKLIFK